jgi:hypothetical protein
MDTQMSQHDDLSLMGFQELDSHLSIFDPGRESSTPGANSTMGYADSNSTNEQPSTTIIVESPIELYSTTLQPQSYFHHKIEQTKSINRNIKKYVPPYSSLFPCHV